VPPISRRSKCAITPNTETTTPANRRIPVHKYVPRIAAFHNHDELFRDLGGWFWRADNATELGLPVTADEWLAARGRELDRRVIAFCCLE
jgi:hypothetical protein